MQTLAGYVEVKPDLKLFAQAEMNNLNLKNVFEISPVSGIVSGNVAWEMQYISDKFWHSLSLRLIMDTVWKLKI
ncbi:MAG: hypothetical protein MZV63_15025 [Marinilabiliales bacterium]|nr:hypothetical protein [Marinilabiliales bacterium]